MVRVEIKWKSERFEVEFNPESPNAVDGLKTAIYQKTGTPSHSCGVTSFGKNGVILFILGGIKSAGVPKERQKLMSKGVWKGVLKDSEDLSKCNIKEGQQVCTAAHSAT